MNGFDDRTKVMRRDRGQSVMGRGDFTIRAAQITEASSPTIASVTKSCQGTLSLPRGEKSLNISGPEIVQNDVEILSRSLSTSNATILPKCTPSGGLIAAHRQMGLCHSTFNPSVLQGISRDEDRF